MSTFKTRQNRLPIATEESLGWYFDLYPEMSSESSRGKPADIINLDRYMRASVLPSRPNRLVQRCGDLVVDAGGIERMPIVRTSSDDTYSDTQPHPPRPAYHKRLSHDSGVSDGSYVKRRHRQIKRHNESNSSRETSRRNESASAMTEFRINCEKAILEQQKQISRLAELCERLVQPNTAGQSKEPPFRRTYKTKQRKRQTSSESSSISSSSSRNSRRKELRPDSCKTYKIIMDRLDDLRHVFANRRPQSVAPGPSSVIVCNKLVATEPLTLGKIANRNAQASTRLTEDSRCNMETGAERRALAATRAQTFDIAPALIERANIVTESVVHDSCSSDDLRSKLHLDDPIRFYAQAKRLQALHTVTKCEERHKSAAAAPSRDPSLCALCRMYWRAIRNRITHTFGTYS